MKAPSFPYTVFPLGDNAITIDYGNIIDESINRQVISRFQQLQKDPLPGMIEAVPAYSSLTIYYNIMDIKKIAPKATTAFEWMKKQTEKRMQEPLPDHIYPEIPVRIPVCYESEFAPDRQQVMNQKRITAEEIIQIHTALSYRVYMLGFLPGFAYMGEIDERLIMPRKSQPVNTLAGSVGIAGKQTGIYPLESPGGWQIIGSTPLQLFDTTKKIPTLLQAGDKVQLYSITKAEFFEMKRASLQAAEKGDRKTAGIS